MKTILFDLSVCQPNGSSKFHGGGIYGCIVAKKIIQEYPNQVAVIYDHSRFLSQDVVDLIIDKGIVSYNLAEMDRLSAFKHGCFDRLYSPLYDKSYSTLMENGVELMVTVHGLRALENNRDLYEWRYARDVSAFMKAILKWTPVYRILDKKYWRQYKRLFEYDKSKIITVSEHSKASLQYFYPNLRDKNIIVRYSPDTSIEYDIIPNSVSSIVGNEPYFLIISADRWLKNSFRAIKAIERMLENGLNIQFRFVVVGFNNTHPIAKTTRYKEKFIYLDYVDKSTLDSLYQNAYALIYPTLNEGFGYPPLEAMRFGIPVLASAVTSIPEVCGDAVMYFNPYSLDEIANRIIQMERPSVHDDYSSRSKKRYREVKLKQDIDLEQLVKDIIN